MRPGRTVLVTGASGGVGTFAVRIAKSMGAEVTVCSTRNVDLVRSIGPDHVIDDTITDLAATRPALTPDGTLIPNSGRGSLRIGPLGRIVHASLRSLCTRQTLRPFDSVERHDDLVALAELVEAGRVGPVIDRRYPLAEAAAALAHVAAGHTRGRVVVSVVA